MPIPPIFTEATEWKPLDAAIRSFGDTDGLTEDDLLAALQAIEAWRERFTDPFTFEHRGVAIHASRGGSLSLGR